MIGTNGPDDLALKVLHVLSHRLHWRIAPRYYSRVETRPVERIDESVDPFAIHFVDPADVTEITRRQVPFFDDRWRLLGAIESGDWDLRETFQFAPDYEKTAWFSTVFSTVQYDDTLFHRSLVDHFCNGADWFDTAYVQTVLEHVDHGDAVWHGCRSRRDVEERCANVDRLYEEIAANGYRTQRSLGTDFKSSREQEIMVDIARNGQLLFVDGRHRLSIAKILKLDEIPVVFGVFHESSFN